MKRKDGADNEDRGAERNHDQSFSQRRRNEDTDEHLQTLKLRETDRKRDLQLNRYVGDGGEQVGLSGW